MKGIFVTGTDTGVGKTVVSAAIVKALAKTGLSIGAMKPVETGCREVAGLLDPSDGMFLRKIAGMDDSIDVVTPERYENPLAPMVAAVLENRPVNLEKVFEAFKGLSQRYEFMVVEGVGGLLVPISGDYFVSDLIKRLGLPVVIVARASLGTINHTLLTVKHASREGLEVKGVIINNHCPPENSLAEKTNPDVLRGLCPVPVLGVLPYLENVTGEGLDRLADYIDIGLLV
ncbi:MAG: dethiobiotin synthase [Nitrospirae bacterium]|nr:MAG: dethiobiotin synthase [Nitrospirota bacterium]